MTAESEDVVSIDVRLPVALFADLDAYAVAHDTTYDAAVTEAIDELADNRV